MIEHPETPPPETTTEEQPPSQFATIQQVTILQDQMFTIMEMLKRTVDQPRTSEAPPANEVLPTTEVPPAAEIPPAKVESLKSSECQAIEVIDGREEGILGIEMFNEEEMMALSSKYVRN
ncbi:hypothetical protein Fot_03740 [Forsythia ovata]|uniref:Uncharacterized protein n=1 Tax=Forsythia ovata TaxID=205694 RepID=A0ABD1XAK0_9LAMI